MKHPGEILQDKLNTNEMTRKELAARTGVTEKHICTVINGERGISTAFARKLGYVFEDAGYWLKRQTEFDEEQLHIQEENSITEDEIAILNPLHDIMSYFIECGYMHNNCGPISKVMQLRVLLNISDLTLIPKITYNAAYRAQLSDNIRIEPHVLFAWQRLCEKKTENITLSNNLDINLLRLKLQDIKAMMFGDINTGIRKLQDLFAECGIKFQVVKNFRGAPVQGFIKKISDEKIILCLTIRRKRADTFWFTLFHEIAHLLNGDYNNRFVDFDSVQNEQEESADKFASDLLINPDKYREFILNTQNITWDDIEQFASSVKVKPFIVLGRLQNDKILDWSDYADKVVKYSWA